MTKMLKKDHIGDCVGEHCHVMKTVITEYSFPLPRVDSTIC